VRCCPFRVDRLAGVDTVGCDRRRLQLGDQMLQLENTYSRGAPPTLSGIGAHGGAIRPGSLRPSRNQICHEGHTIVVDHAAVPTFIAHGDSEGPCS
jgi:hypothetical protein